MVRASKTTQSAPVVSATPAPVEQAPVKKAAAKKPKAEKVAAPVAETEPVSAPAPVSAAAPVEPAADADASLQAKLNVFGAKLQLIGALHASLKTEYKSLEKAVTREIKLAQKASSRKKKSTGNRAPSGFVKPALISDELAVFLGKEVGTEMARTDVSKMLNTYIRENNLKDKTNGRHIIPDDKLSVLLKLSKDDVLTYFNLQRFMKPHFIKAPVATA
jgi:upstream activation factor subunit UAF30